MLVHNSGGEFTIWSSAHVPRPLGPALWSRAVLGMPPHPTGDFWLHPQFSQEVAEQGRAWLWAKGWIPTLPPPSQPWDPGLATYHAVMRRIWLSKTSHKKRAKQMYWPSSGLSKVVSPKSLNHIKKYTCLYNAAHTLAHAEWNYTSNNTIHRVFKNQEVWCKSPVQMLTICTEIRYLDVGNMRRILAHKLPLSSDQYSNAHSGLPEWLGTQCQL